LSEIYGFFKSRFNTIEGLLDKNSKIISKIVENKEIQSEMSKKIPEEYKKYNVLVDILLSNKEIINRNQNLQKNMDGFITNIMSDQELHEIMQRMLSDGNSVDVRN
jgi:hypothetical protein